jgi:hypothetical protein
MKLRTTLALSAMALLSMASSAAIAQNALPTYQADSDVYKLIFEDKNFRVIAATWKPGVRDKAHSHPYPSIAYTLTDCTIRLHSPDGKTRDVNNKAGTAQTVPTTKAHFAENIGPGECRVLFVERK